MATIGQVRGMLLEEVVLNLLVKVGYRTVNPGEDGTSLGPAGLLLRGRGTWHQIDALAALDHGPAFTYPIRLLVEAKCYARYPVDISTIRNCVGVLRDVSENYFVQRDEPNLEEPAIPRFNFLSAVFSTTGYSIEAQRYALAHQIFLIQYKRVPALQAVITGLMGLGERDFATVWRNSFWRENASPSERHLSDLRHAFRDSLTTDYPLFDRQRILTQDGARKLTAIIRSIRDIRGSYYGMIQGRYPVHLLSGSELSSHLFQLSDNVECRIYADRPETWMIEPTEVRKDQPGYFRLEFGLPDHVAQLVQRVWGSAEELANAKREHFSFIALTGVIGGVRRQVNLVLDNDWLERYLERVRIG